MDHLNKTAKKNDTTEEYDDDGGGGVNDIGKIVSRAENNFNVTVKKSTNVVELYWILR